MAIANNSWAERHASEVKYYGQNGEEPYWPNVTRLDSCGGWIASPTDLVQFGMRLSDVLKPAAITAMTTPLVSNPNYAKGWAVNEVGTRWHVGSLPGTKAILVHRRSGFCWAAIANTRDKTDRKSVMNGDLLALLPKMAGQVAGWRA